jgi:hypothetical protein
LKGYDIWKKITEETKGGERFKDHPLSKKEFREVKENEV